MSLPRPIAPKRSLWERLVNNGLLLVGALILITCNVIAIFRPDLYDDLNVLRSIGSPLFLLGVTIRLITLESRTDVAMQVHDRMENDIYDLKRTKNNFELKNPGVFDDDK